VDAAVGPNSPNQPENSLSEPGSPADKEDLQKRIEFEASFSQSQRQLLLFLVSMVGNIADAEDVLQRCSLIMWKKFNDYDRSKSFLAWGCGIAKLEAYNFRRSRSAESMVFHSDVVELLAQSLEQMPEQAQHQRLAALKSCMQTLPPQEQEFLRRLYWEGSSFDVIAAELGCTIRTFYNRMYLLRKRLSRCVTRRLKAETDSA